MRVPFIGPGVQGQGSDLSPGTGPGPDVPSVAYQYMAAAIMEQQKPFSERFEEAKQAQMGQDKLLSAGAGPKHPIHRYYGDEQTGRDWLRQQLRERQEGRTRPSAQWLKAEEKQMEEQQKIDDAMMKKGGGGLERRGKWQGGNI